MGSTLGQEDLREGGTATHCSILARRIPWTEEPGGLVRRVAQSQARLKPLSTHARKVFPVVQAVKHPPQCGRPGFHPWVGKSPWRRKWQPTPVSCLENPKDGGAWQATVHELAKSWTRLSN